MDTAERLTSTLLAALTEAESLVRTGQKGVELRGLVRHAREIHELLLEALLEHPALSTVAIRDVAETSGRTIDQLEALAIPHSEKH
jgi:hypothetical protein